jgi:hypothetical protein
MAAGSPDHLSICGMTHPASLAKDKAAQLVTQLFDLLGIVGGAKAFGQLEECFFLVLAGFNSLLDEFHENAVITEIAFFGYGVDLFGNLGRQGYAAPDILYRGGL